MTENRAKMIECIMQALDLGIRKLHYSEEGMPPGKFKGKLHYIRVPSYTVVLSGDLKRHMMTNGVWILQPVPAGEAIFTVSNAFSSPVNGAECLGVVLNPNFIRLIYTDTTNLPSEKYPYRDQKFPFCYYHVHDSFRPATAGIIRTMELLANSKDNSGTGLKLLRISLEMILQDLKNSRGGQGGALGTFRQILQFINEHHLEDIMRPDLAAYFNVTPSYISKLFKRFRGNENFSRYLLNSRLDSAVILLRSEDIAIKEIALRCFFNSFSYFIRRFKERFDMTPALYRKSITRKTSKL
jgi:AraC-like DNA-binding protein